MTCKTLAVITLCLLSGQAVPSPVASNGINFPLNDYISNNDGSGSQPLPGFEPDAQPNGPDGNFKKEFPFSDKCERHIVNLTTKAPRAHMEQEDTLAFFPMMNVMPPVALIININDNNYKCSILGSEMKVEVCDKNLLNCEEISSPSKSRKIIKTTKQQLIKSHHWNYFYGTLKDHHITLNLNNMTSAEIHAEESLSEMNDAEWYFGVEEINTNAAETATTTTGSSPFFLTQSPCAEFRSEFESNDTRHNMPEGQTQGEVEEEEDEANSTGVIVGIVMGCLLLALIVAIIVTVSVRHFKKSRTANISAEQAPISNTKE